MLVLEHELVFAPRAGPTPRDRIMAMLSPVGISPDSLSARRVCVPRHPPQGLDVIHLHLMAHQRIGACPLPMTEG
jgi:hypothetical protein